jgi:hypothetical protein
VRTDNGLASPFEPSVTFDADTDVSVPHSPATVPAEPPPPPLAELMAAGTAMNERPATAMAAPRDLRDFMMCLPLRE